jgi:DNA adenine methylase
MGGVSRHMPAIAHSDQGIRRKRLPGDQPVKLQAPFPWFGGKSRVAGEVWRRFGYVPNYVEPFFGSGAVLLGRPALPPGTTQIETVNDIDGMVSNFWRAVAAEPQTVASFADSPVNENDLHARHIWLVGQKRTLVQRLEGDPHFYDAKIAGWWVWGMACWIGGGFCSGSGPWSEVNGQLVHLGGGADGQGVNRKRVHLGGEARFVNRGKAPGVSRRKISTINYALRDADASGLIAWFEALAARLRRVRVCCGDWSRIISPAVTTTHGLTGVFLDPPYSAAAGRHAELYSHDSGDVAFEARAWAIANGDNPQLRIALCGYDGEYTMPKSWRVHAWKAQGGYGMLGHGKGRENKHRERIWFSPHCLK